MDSNEKSTMKYSINLSFEEIKLPPFEDILVLGKNSPHGKLGLNKSLGLLLPNGFELVEIGEGNVEAVFINRKILAKISKEKIIDILGAHVFQYVSESELLRVNFKVLVSCTNIEYDI